MACELASPGADGDRAEVRETVAVLLARDSVWSAQAASPLEDTPRPLRTLAGRPVFDYTLQALQASPARHILVLHDQGVDLASHATSAAKAIFAECAPEPRGVFASLTWALSALTWYLGAEAIARSNLLLIPFDLPLVRSPELSALMRLGCRPGFHCTVPLTSLDLLKRRYPGWHSPSLAFRDLGGHYVFQFAVLVNGAMLRCGKWEGRRRPVLALQNVSDAQLQWVACAMDSAYRFRAEARGSRLFIPVLAVRSGIVSRLLRRSPTVIASYFARNLTTERLSQAVRHACGVNAHFAVIDAPELSLDADTPQQLRRLEVIQRMISPTSSPSSGRP